MSGDKCEGCGEPIAPEAVDVCSKCHAPAKAPSPQQGPPPSPGHRRLNIALKTFIGIALFPLVPFGTLLGGYCLWSAYSVWRGRRLAENTAKWAGGAVFSALLVGVAIPKFRELTRKGKEGASRGNVSAIRHANSIYYGDMAGVYPSSLDSLTRDGKYLRNIPLAIFPYYHRDSAKVTVGKVPDDSGGWLYDNDPKDKDFGMVFFNCTHTDTKGSSWHSY